jgi:hypothetical protein
MGDVVDRDRIVIETFILLLSGGIGSCNRWLTAHALRQTLSWATNQYLCRLLV